MLRNYLITLINRANRDLLVNELAALCADYPGMLSTNFGVTPYQPHAKPGNTRYMGVVRLSVKAGTPPPTLPEGHYIAVD